MPLFLTYLTPEAASSFYTLLHVGKDANVISIDLTLVTVAGAVRLRLEITRYVMTGDG